LNIDILSFFQNDKQPRQGQITILLEFCRFVQEGYKNIIIEAPTGVGKSAIAYTILRFFKSGFITTAQKSLQEQYKNEYPEFFDIRGKSNFTCNFKDEALVKKSYKCGICHMSYDKCFHKFSSLAPCVTDDEIFKEIDEEKGDGQKKIVCPYYVEQEDYELNRIEDDINKRGLIQSITLSENKRQEMINDRLNGKFSLAGNKSFTKRQKRQIVENFKPCHYYDQLDIGLRADYTILNYANYILFTYMQKLNRRKVTIFDEAHSIEDQIIDFAQLTFEVDEINEILGGGFEIADSFDIMDHVPVIEKLHEIFEERAKMPAKSDSAKKLKKEAKDWRDKLDRTLKFIALDMNNWKVVELERNKYNEIEKAVYKPINLSSFCQQIYKNSEYNIFMSATILDQNMYCEMHGLDPALTAFISIPSDFPIRNRPIYRMNVAHLNKDTIKDTRIQQKITEAVDKLMTNHKNEKGIIHTSSTDQVDFIFEYISEENKKRLRRTEPKLIKSEIVVENHKKDKGNPTVLISPSLHTGIDLPYDDSRFQIIVKVPYPNLGDKWTWAKMQDNANWFIYKTALKIVQSYGRSVRAIDDTAVTYILDSAFQNDFMIRPNAVMLLPRWFKDAIIINKQQTI
jgi:ATP-dependent DNA helicase DinG